MNNVQLDAQPKTLYVSGIVMDFGLQDFLLINKGGLKLKDGTILKWQGIGGHINSRNSLVRPESEILAAIPGSSQHKVIWEEPHAAMTREFQEETGHAIAKMRWHCYYIKDYGKTKVYFFICFASPSEISEIIIKTAKINNPEGPVAKHNMVDVLFDPNSYTFDLPYLLNMIHREMKVGMLLKLDPEGINTSGKLS